MAKGPEITDEVKALASKLHEEHPKWTNSMIRNEVLGIVHQKKPSLPKDWPSKFAIDRIMPDIREKLRLSKLTPNPIDEPWSTATMAEYQISPEALPTVLALWAWMLENLHVKLTIRQAQWAARLYTVAEKMHVYTFSMLCRSHAITEMIYERIGAHRGPFHGADWYMFCSMTGQDIDPLQVDKTGMFLEPEDVYFDLTDEELADMLDFAKTEELESKFETMWLYQILKEGTERAQKIDKKAKIREGARGKRAIMEGQNEEGRKATQHEKRHKKAR